jgi:glycosyltransferase involved in cell wall biosynthesis
MCEVRNAHSLAEAMRRFATLEPQRRLAIGAAARRLVEERFSEDVVISAYRDALQQLVPPGGLT